MLDVINASSRRCFGTKVKIPECVLPGTFPMRFSTDLLHKDVALGGAEAGAMGARMWVVKFARDLLAYSKERGDGALDYAHIVTYFEDWAGGDVKVRAKDGAELYIASRSASVRAITSVACGGRRAAGAHRRGGRSLPRWCAARRRTARREFRAPHSGARRCRAARRSR